MSHAMKPSWSVLDPGKLWSDLPEYPRDNKAYDHAVGERFRRGKVLSIGVDLTHETRYVIFEVM